MSALTGVLPYFMQRPVLFFGTGFIPNNKVLFDNVLGGYGTLWDMWTINETLWTM
jgi:hypothetical protein